jgi:hypothetical protein
MKYTNIPLLAAGILFAAACRLPAQSGAAEGENILTNGTFEAWTPFVPPSSGMIPPILDDDTLPEGFGVGLFEAGSTPAVKIAADGKIKHGGRFSVRIENTALDQAGSIYLMPVGIEGGTAYKIRMWIKGENIVADQESDGVQIWAHSGPAEDFWSNPASRREMVTPESHEGTFNWTPVEFTYQTREGEGLLRIVLVLHNATGKVWLDDLEVIPLGKK